MFAFNVHLDFILFHIIFPFLLLLMKSIDEHYHFIIFCTSNLNAYCFAFQNIIKDYINYARDFNFRAFLNIKAKKYGII